MRLERVFVLSVSLLMSSITAVADTVQTRNNAICNGTVISLNAEVLVFEANIQGKQQVFSIKRRDLKMIEFNNLKANREVPKGPFLMQEPAAGTAESLPASPPKTVVQQGEDTVVRRGGAGALKGTVVAIDANQISVSGAAPIARSMVSAIVFSGK